MAKKVYQAIGKDGIVYERKTDREYGFAVVFRGQDAKSGPSFCGRADLADKVANGLRALAARNPEWIAQKYNGTQVDVLIAKRIK